MHHVKVDCQTPVVVVRPARRGEENEVARVHVRSWQAGYHGLLPGSYLDRLRPEDRATRYSFGDTDSDGPYTIVAADDSDIRGFASIGSAPGERGTGELLALYVDPDWWGHGIGRALIREARRLLAEQGCIEAILWLLVGNDRGERFYRADGWSPDGTRRQDEVWGISVDELRFVRPLP
jgi:GNAT superfamily N-acetyltransferase